uniref:Iron-binding zinc finger CDGSH type, putative n=1 Tax=Theileria annulata TaxID=5874 RepID=A0A3B0MWY2_THEAN
MSSPLDYLQSLNFNTKHFQKFSQIVETFPPTDAKDVKVCVCRCWQSKKFPYCDGTHKLLMENGDNVGPYVAILKAQKTIKNNVIRIKHPLSSNNKNYVNNTPKSPAKIFTLGRIYF